jgi:putative copper export protein/methionine-rich copper-binding protein CopC
MPAPVTRRRSRYRRPPSARFTSRLLRLGLVLSGLAILALPVALLAHTHLRRSSPAADERLATAPTEIRLWFSERPQVGFSRLRLVGADSADQSLGAVAVMPQDPLGLVAAVPGPLAPGRYAVIWQTAGADGHIIRGRYTFALAASAPVAGAAASPAATASHPDSVTHPSSSGHQLVRIRRGEETSERLNAYVTARWVEFVALLTILGVLAFRLIVLPKLARAPAGLVSAPPSSALIGEVGDSARRLGESALVLLLLAALTRLYAESAAMHGAERALDTTMLRAMITTTSWGIGWLIGAAGIAVTALGLFLARRTRAGWNIAALGALGLVLAPALTGHAAASPWYFVAVTVDTLHVAGAGAWLGTLLVLMLVGISGVRRWSDDARASIGSPVAALFHAFHPMALACGGLVVASGLLSGWMRLQSLPALWETTYGRILLLKVAAFIVVAALGLFNSRRLLPAAQDPDFGHRIKRSASLELAFTALVLALTAVLVSTATPESDAVAAAAASSTVP